MTEREVVIFTLDVCIRRSYELMNDYASDDTKHKYYLVVHDTISKMKKIIEESLEGFDNGTW